MDNLKKRYERFYRKIICWSYIKTIFYRVIEVKIEDENYTEFIEVFLNEYITFYSVKLYKDINNEFVINDIYILVIKI